MTALRVDPYPPSSAAGGHIEPLPSGSFRAVVYAGIDPLTGRQHYQRTTALTYDLAQIELTNLQKQVDDGRQPKSWITVGNAIDQRLEVAKLEDTREIVTTT